MLLLLTFIMPRVEVGRHAESPREIQRPRLFEDEVRQVEVHLQAGTLSEVDQAVALSLAPSLKVRALSRVGSMTPREMEEAVELLEEFQIEIGAQPTRATRETMRHHRNQLLFERFQRVDADQGVVALDAVREAFLETFDVDPAGPATH